MFEELLASLLFSMLSFLFSPPIKIGSKHSQSNAIKDDESKVSFNIEYDHHVLVQISLQVPFSGIVGNAKQWLTMDSRKFLKHLTNP
jgi:hypothetical protein